LPKSFSFLERLLLELDMKLDQWEMLVAIKFSLSEPYGQF
jgi:hypothetical protein